MYFFKTFKKRLSVWPKDRDGHARAYGFKDNCDTDIYITDSL